MTRVWLNRAFSSVRAVLDLVRQGDQTGEYQLVCSHPRPSFPGFLSAHEHAIEPSGLSEAEYVQFCLDFCRERGIDALWPGQAAQAIVAERERFAELGVRVLAVATPETLALLEDKARFYAEARRFSIPPPQSLTFATAADFDACYAQLRLDHDVLCIKPSVGINGAGFRMIDEHRGALELLLQNAMHSVHLAGLQAALSAADRFQPMLLMEHLGGLEYSVDCVADGRRVLALVQRQKPTASVYGQLIVSVPAIEQAVQEMTEAFGLRGLFNVQFREGRDGLRLLEINARFSGGIGYTGAAGVNLPYLALKGWTQGFDALETTAARAGTRVLELLHYQHGEYQHGEDFA
ncbi:ATP-grasp domain-containing protein [Thiocystis violacea]|uniref:ATP-grasp domain-containing protein n=1 Tax=Thiocystis violacea TaxID=13725 RepID=UPI001907F817|nr:ATP-grasp domain-containing protein [Thiocystis violacea]MBK1721651.1 biotin carboxylase [Thiocystis violacea]